MRTAFIQELLRVAEEDDRVMLVVGDLGFGVVEPFAERFPLRFVNAGVAEQNMTGMAAGMALSGGVVFTYSIANFPTLRCLEQIREAQPDVFNHNVETVRRLTPEVRGRAKYDQSLAVLKYMSGETHGGQFDEAHWSQATRGVEPHPTLLNDMSRGVAGAVVKSGFMVGLGEGREEILELLGDLRESGVEMLTIGQYLCPSRLHRPVTRYYHPDEFGQIKEAAEGIGFEQVASGPYVRSSYHAEDSCASLRRRMA